MPPQKRRLGTCSRAVDLTIVRTIEPQLREDVLNIVLQHQDMHDVFMHILLTMGKMDSFSPLCNLAGHEISILPIIAAFAGVSGWSAQKLEDIVGILEDATEYDVDNIADANNH